MNNIESFNVYQINSKKSITKYHIVRLNGEYKIKKRCKESFIHSSCCVQRLLELEEQGYNNINIFLSLLNKKDISKLFDKNKTYKSKNKIKRLKLNL